MQAAEAAHLLVKQLVARGVKRFVLSPGSRSAPLAYALADGEQAGHLELYVRLDERGAAFFALGLATASGEPVAVVCTSGTAVANFHPAVLEADLARVPLIILTADRPVELRGVLASQTIDQVGVFSSAVRGCLDLPPPDSTPGGQLAHDDAAAAFALAGVVADVNADGGSGRDFVGSAAASNIVKAANWAVNLATAPNYPGPVHLNLQYREPLYPVLQPTPLPLDKDLTEGIPPVSGPAGLRDSASASHALLAPHAIEPSATDVYIQLPRRLSMSLNDVRQRSALSGLDWELYLPGSRAKTVVIAGDGAGPLAREVAENNGWPLLAEPTSGALGSPNNIAGYRNLLPFLPGGFHEPVLDDVNELSKGTNQSKSQPSLFDRMMPKYAVVFGRPTLNRAVNKFLSRPDVEVLVVATGEPPWPDAWLNTAAYVNGDELAKSEALTNGQARPKTTEFLRLWQGAGQKAARVIEGELERQSESGVNPLALAQAVWGAPGQLVVGASNPIRDLDLVASGSGPTRVFSNRGVAGIDGTIATALGIAAARTERQREAKPAQGVAAPSGTEITRLYLGDLTFLHDVAALLQTAGETRPQLQIIIANDNGGTIFSSLEHGEWTAGDPNRQHILSRVFTTPQVANIEQLCAGYGVNYRKASTMNEVKAALAHPSPQIEVIEVVVNGQNRQTELKSLQQSVAESCKDILSLR